MDRFRPRLGPLCAFQGMLFGHPSTIPTSGSLLGLGDLRRQVLGDDIGRQANRAEPSGSKVSSAPPAVDGADAR